MAARIVPDGTILHVFTNSDGFTIASLARLLVAASAGTGVHWAVPTFEFQIASTTSAAGIVNGEISGLVLEDTDGNTIHAANADATIQGDAFSSANPSSKALPQGVSFLGRMQPVANKSIYLKNYNLV